MSHDFVETGQTFTEDGAPFCPVERRQGGVIGVAAGLGVLLAGAGFLVYAVAAAPGAPEAAVAAAPAAAAAEPAAPQQTGDPLTSETPATASTERAAARDTALEAALAQVASAPGGAASPAPATPSAPSSPGVETATLIAEALAESRAARAAADGPAYGFRAPRLKPARGVVSLQTVAYDIADAAFAPRIKPTINGKIANAPARAITPIGAVATAAAARVEPAVIFLPEAGAHRRFLAPAVAYAGDFAPDARAVTVRIKRGETFVDALNRAGVAAADRNAAAYAFGKHYNLRRLRPGQEFNLRLGWPNQTIFQIADSGEPEARLISLSFRNGFEQHITVTRNASGFDATAAEIPLTTHLHAIEGRIDGSLYVSAKALGAPDDIIADLADAFAYDVDFQREIFGGDEYEVVFEAKYDDEGRMAGGGDILFARLHWRGKSREKGYYRFEDGEDGRADYYDATGQSAKRLLMKTPIDGARLSSGFGTRRHPILGYRKAHKGVDFAAPRGTPIKAAGDGVVERADRYGSFGNYIRIRHANGYKTAYAHLNGFRKGIRKGKRVRQGDIIGYVGTTGRSTGPHLHYEVHLNGKAVNPQRLKIATGKQLKGDALQRFKQERDRIDALRRPANDAPPLFAEGEEAPPKENL